MHEQFLNFGVTQSVEGLRDERGRLKQHVATLEEKGIGAQMETHKLRKVLSDASMRANEIGKQLSLAVSDSRSAICHARYLAAQDEHLNSEINSLNSDLRTSRQEAESFKHQLSDAQVALAANTEKLKETESMLSAANAANEDLRCELAKALVANSSISGIQNSRHSLFLVVRELT